jgi:hypothetical protein
MPSPDRILVPFSGQRDAVELTVSAIDHYRPQEVILFFVQNIGFRPSYDPPLATARALAREHPQIRRLLVTDARLLQVEAIGAMPPRFSQKLGVRTFCTACQASLLFLSSRVAELVDATLLVGPREGLGHDLDPIFRGLTKGIPGTPSVRRLATVPIAEGQRCRLAVHHADGIEPLEPAMRDDLERWLHEQGAALPSVPLEAFDLGGDDASA